MWPISFPGTIFDGRLPAVGEAAPSTWSSCRRDRTAAGKPEDAVEPLHSGQTVRDEQHAATERHLIERRQKRPLGFRVETGARLVEYQNGSRR